MPRFKEPESTSNTTRTSRATQPARASQHARVAQPNRAAASARTSRATGAARVRGVQSYRAQVESKYQKSEAPKGVLLGIVIAAVVVIVLVVVLALNALGSSSTTSAVAATTEQQTSAAVNEDLTLDGHTYSLGQDVQGFWVLNRTSADGTENIIYSFEGTPVALLTAGGKLYAPQNKSDGSWDIVCYMPAVGGEPYKLSKDDSELTGTGTLASAELQQDVSGTSSLVLTDESGATTTVALS